MFLKRIGKVILIVGMGFGVLSTSNAFALRDIDPIDFTVSYATSKDVPGDAYKIHDGSKASGNYVVNLKKSSGSANVTTTLHNSNHENRGRGVVQRGETGKFYNTGKQGYYYHMNLKRTYSGGNIVVKGSWSPDYLD